MPAAEIRVYFDNQPADPDLLDKFGEIRVDQAIGMAAEAQIPVVLAADTEGNWPALDEDFVQPMRRVRIEVRTGTGDFVALIDGPIVAQRIEMSAEPNMSLLTLVAHDDTALLSLEEEVALFEDLPAHEIARTLYQARGLDARVEDTEPASGSLTRYVVRRGTEMQLLRELARQTGMYAYVEPGSEPGTSVGVFARPEETAGDLPDLVLMGADRNVHSFSVEFDALRPLRASARSIDIAAKSVLTALEDAISSRPLGSEPVHDAVSPGATLLARTRETQSDLTAATRAAVDASGWALAARAEVTAEVYPAVMTPYKVIRVLGAGGRLSGDYLISDISHVIGFAAYTQTVGLRRNARSSGGGGLAGAVGGLF